MILRLHKGFADTEQRTIGFIRGSALDEVAKMEYGYRFLDDDFRLEIYTSVNLTLDKLGWKYIFKERPQEIEELRQLQLKQFSRDKKLFKIYKKDFLTRMSFD